MILAGTIPPKIEVGMVLRAGSGLTYCVVEKYAYNQWKLLTSDGHHCYLRHSKFKAWPLAVDYEAYK